MLDKINMRLSSNIRMALSLLLNQRNVTLSWGLSNIEIRNNSVSFHVDGFTFSGNVKIEENSSQKFLYNIYFDDVLKTTLNQSTLIKYLDEHIEYNEDYSKNLLNEIENKMK